MNESMNRDKSVPRWYVVYKQEKIIAGIGVIENDFHDCKERVIFSEFAPVAKVGLIWEKNFWKLKYDI